MKNRSERLPIIEERYSDPKDIPVLVGNEYWDRRTIGLAKNIIKDIGVIGPEHAIRTLRMRCTGRWWKVWGDKGV